MKEPRTHTMDHFSLEDWADVARGVADANLRAAMQDHLDRACDGCTELHALLSLVTKVAARDADYEPPPAALGSGKAALVPPSRLGGFARASQAVKLLFDSQLVAAPVGVRNAVWGPPRRLVFASGSLVVDLQVAPSTGSGVKVLIGQVTASRHPIALQVLLNNGRQKIAQAATNDLGEFELEFENPGDSLTLALGSDEDVTVISLGTL